MNDGGPAFPGIVGEEGRGNLTQQFAPDGRNVFIGHAHGMSLRDWFAGQLIGPLLAGNVTAVLNGCPPLDHLSMARDAYKIADAMIAQREKKAGA